MSKDSRSSKPGGQSKPRGGNKPHADRPRDGRPAKRAAGPARRPGQRAAVYRRRRAVLGVLAAIVLAAAIFGIAQGVSFVKGQFASDEPEAAASSSAEPTGPSEQELANPTTCGNDAVGLRVAPQSTSVPAGEGLKVPITITNDGKVQCLIDLGNANLEMTVTSGEEKVWSTAQCPANPEEYQVLLAPGASEADAITWSGRHSSQGCPKDSPVAEPGTYQIEVSVNADGGTVTAQRTVEVTE